MIGKPFLFLDNIKYFSMSHIEPEHINIQAVPQSVDNAEYQRQRDIVLIIILGEYSVDISDVNINQGIKPKGSAVEQVQQQPGKNPIKHPRILSMDETKGERED